MIFNELFNKNESTVGSIKCLEKDLGNKVLSIAQNFGMKNPNKAVINSSKGIKVKKVGKGVYLIGLMMFEPPKYIVWTTPQPIEKLNESLINLSGEIVSYINVVEVKASTTPYFQLALAKSIN